MPQRLAPSQRTHYPCSNSKDVIVSGAVGGMKLDRRVQSNVQEVFHQDNSERSHPNVEDRNNVAITFVVVYPRLTLHVFLTYARTNGLLEVE